MIGIIIEENVYNYGRPLNVCILSSKSNNVWYAKPSQKCQIEVVAVDKCRKLASVSTKLQH